MSNSAGILILDKTQREQNAEASELLHSALRYKDISVDETFTSAKALFSSVGGALSANQTVIVAAEPAVFYAAKNMLIKVLSLKTAENSDVAALLPVGYTPKSDEEYAAVTQFPKKAKVFPTKNGLFTGFMLSAGGKNLLFLPLKTSCLKDYLKGEIGQFISNLDNEKITSRIIPPQHSAPPQKKAAALPELPTADAQTLCMQLEAKDAKIAVAQMGPTGALKELFGSGSAFIFDESPCRKWTSGEFNDYFAAEVKACAERNGADTGIAVSGLYSDKDTNEKFMFCCVADKTGADIVKVTGENAASVASDCMCHLVEMLSCHVSDEKTDSVTLPAAAKPVVKTKRELIIASVAIALSVIVCAILAFAVFKNPNPSSVDSLPQQGIEQSAEQSEFPVEDSSDYSYQE